MSTFDFKFETKPTFFIWSHLKRTISLFVAGTKLTPELRLDKLL